MSYWLFTSHEYAQKEISSTSLTIKVQNVYRQMERAYTGFSQMKQHRLVLLVGSEKVSNFISKEQNIRTKKMSSR